MRNELDARRIVMRAGMSARPEFYSGRGASSSDLNDRILEGVYQGVQESYGDEAANQFARMVADIPKLSATDFLNTLYRLEHNNWKWNKRLLGNERGIDVGPDMGDGGRDAIARVTVGCVLSGMRDRDETAYIREEFLRRHNIKDKQKANSRVYYLERI